MRRFKLNGNVKDDHEDEIPDWVDDEEVSDYHTFTVPYGPKFHARKIERLLYAKDLLLNAEWNRPKERETTLHRHPAFFGNAEDVIGDCCGHCPEPETSEDEEIAEVEKKIYVSGDLTFIKDDPGRQAIGSFNPIDEKGWTEMAYVGNTARLCQAIVDGDAEHVQDWLNQDGADPNERDYTGRTPLQLAVMSSTPEIVQILIDAGARIVARMVDGRTALHLAAMRGEAAMVRALLVKSEANEEKEAEKEEARIAQRKAEKEANQAPKSDDTRMNDVDAEPGSAHSDEDIDMLEESDADEDVDATTEGSIINIRSETKKEENNMPIDEDEDEPDVYDVNVLAWDTPVSPLHLAITNGHIEVVKLLVQDFGADVILPVKLLKDHDKSPRAAILPLVLALQLESQQADEMTKTLIALGASPAQADLEGISALHYFAAKNAALLKTMISANQPGAKRAVNHLSISGSSYSPEAKSALQSAIEHGDVPSIDALLELGAQPQVDFAAFMSSFKTKWEARGSSEENQKTFQRQFQQPVLTAVQHELPSVVIKLLDAGADINSLSGGAWRTVHDRTTYGYESVQSLLDATREKIKILKDWVEKDEASKPVEEDEASKPVTTTNHYGHTTQVFPPVPLEEDSHYLGDLTPGTYAYWTTLKQLQSAKRTFEKDTKEYEDAAKGVPKKSEGRQEKLAAVKTLLAEYESLESVLQERGAKTFKELYPDIKLKKNRSYNSYEHKQEPPKPWTPMLGFNLPDLTEDQRKAYVELFEASWKSDLDTIKSLTLAVWGEDQTPLKISVLDTAGFSPFSIAVLQQHFDLAKAILEIAQAQYAPEEKTGRSKYSLTDRDYDDEEDESDAGDADEIRLFHEFVDDKFTVENIGEVQNQVKSRHTALDVLSWHCPVSQFLEEDDSPDSSSGSFTHLNRGDLFYGRKSYGKAPRRILKDAVNGRTYRVAQQAMQESYEDVEKPSNLLQLAIYTDDANLLGFLLDAGEEYTIRRGSTDDEPASKFYAIKESDFHYAIKLGRVQLLKAIVTRTGAGIPLDTLVKKSGVEIAKKPKYYQGLSVHGKKREDWAAAGRDTHYQAPQEEHPPLLHAARLTNIDSIEWFLSDAATHAYYEFAENNKKDVRIRNLAKAKGGLQSSISKWLNLRSKLMIQVVVLSETNDQSLAVLRHLCETQPEAINHRSAKGMTALQLAFSLHRVEMAKILIEAGADQTARNHEHHNLVHAALFHKHTDEGLKKVRQLLELVDTRLVSGMFTERASCDPGAVTPLAQWLYMVRSQITQWNYVRSYNYNNYNNCNDKDAKSGVDLQQDYLRTLLEFSKGEDLGLVNGEGDTPLHAAVRYDADHLLAIMLTCRPELLFRENASGRTPYEMAEDAHLAINVYNAPPSIGVHVGRRRTYFGSSSEATTNILEKSAESFVQAKTDSRQSTEAVWDVCKEFKAKTGAGKKRKLVSLLEANEVAKRLASKKHKTEEDDADSKAPSVKSDDEEKGKGDEVSAWLWMGLRTD